MEGIFRPSLSFQAWLLRVIFRLNFMSPAIASRPRIPCDEEIADAIVERRLERGQPGPDPREVAKRIGPDTRVDAASIGLRMGMPPGMTDFDQLARLLIEEGHIQPDVYTPGATTRGSAPGTDLVLANPKSIEQPESHPHDVNSSDGQGWLSVFKSAASKIAEFISAAVRQPTQMWRACRAALASGGAILPVVIDGDVMISIASGAQISSDPKQGNFREYSGRDNRYYDMYRDLKAARAARGEVLRTIGPAEFKELGVATAMNPDGCPTVFIDGSGEVRMSTHHRIRAVLENPDLKLRVIAGIDLDPTSYS